MDDPIIEKFVGRSALRLSEDEVRELLRESEYGLLALAEDGKAYAVPVSAGYDGESALFFQFGFDDESKKRKFIDATEKACFVVYNIDPPNWESVIVTGSIMPVPEAELEIAYKAHRDNAWTPMNAFEKPLDQVEFEFYMLEIETVTGIGTRTLD